jgi:hypothetical protein
MKSRGWPTPSKWHVITTKVAPSIISVHYRLMHLKMLCNIIWTRLAVPYHCQYFKEIHMIMCHHHAFSVLRCQMWCCTQTTLAGVLSSINSKLAGFFLIQNGTCRSAITCHLLSVHPSLNWNFLTFYLHFPVSSKGMRNYQAKEICLIPVVFQNN